MKTIVYWIYDVRDDDIDFVYNEVDKLLSNLKGESVIGDFESEESG